MLWMEKIQVCFVLRRCVMMVMHCINYWNRQNLNESSQSWRGSFFIISYHQWQWRQQHIEKYRKFRYSISVERKRRKNAWKTKVVYEPNFVKMTNGIAVITADRVHSMKWMCSCGSEHQTKKKRKKHTSKNDIWMTKPKSALFYYSKTNSCWKDKPR